MIHAKSSSRAAGVIAGLLVIAPAQAYIDPNTGGLIFQMLAPLFAMVVSAWLFARDAIVAYWRRLFGRSKPTAAPDTVDAPEKTTGPAP